MSVAIVWFRRDLRLDDNPALAAAARHHDRILPVYIHAPEEEGEWAPGAASRWWLQHSLGALDASLRKHHGGLHIRQGESLQVLRDLIDASGASTVYWNRMYDPDLVKRDTLIKSHLRQRDVHVASFDGALWRSPWQVKTKQDEPYRVFTPFWRNLRAQLGEEPPLQVPSPLSLHEMSGGASIESLELLPQRDWASQFGEAWTPGEAGATDALELFADDALSAYKELRDRPARHGTSRLSPHLHFGEIGPRRLLARLRQVGADGRRRPQPDIEPYLRQLGWREFAHHLLFHYPRTTHENLDQRFNRYPWAREKDALRLWQRGRTGIPLVDAGMRELWATGWMHNRVRMVAASLLTKNLRHHWLDGARWFWDTLVDADLANNTLGWQWVAGCGADAAPYFRVFNPVTQAKRFDADGEYVRRWVPELRDAPKALLHEPWQDNDFLQRSGYAEPIVDLKVSRERALSGYQTVRNG